MEVPSGLGEKILEVFPDACCSLHPGLDVDINGSALLQGPSQAGHSVAHIFRVDGAERSGHLRVEMRRWTSRDWIIKTEWNSN